MRDLSGKITAVFGVVHKRGLGSKFLKKAESMSELISLHCKQLFFLSSWCSKLKFRWFVEVIEKYCRLK